MAKKKETPLERQIGIQRKMELAQQRSSKAKLPESLELLKGETKIILPYQINMMGGTFSKVQQEVILDMYDHIKAKLILQLNPEYDKSPVLSLFKPEDFEDEIDSGTFLRIEMSLKDFGVKPSHYPELRGALLALPSVLVSLPYIDKQKRKWTKSESLFSSVYVGTEKYDTSCIIKIKKEMAELAIDMKQGYGEIGRKASRSLSTKYAGRLHMLMSQFGDMGGFTLSIKDFRRIMGIEKKYLNDWSKVEKHTLLNPKKEIDEKFSEGSCDYYYTYELLYNNRPENGFPDAIKFSVYSAVSPTERKLIVLEKTLAEQFEKDLEDILAVPKSVCSTLSKRVTAENGKAAISKIIELHTWMLTHEVKTNKAMFVVKSLNNFFDTFISPATESQNLAPQAKWNKIQESIGKGRSSDVTALFSQLLFKEYNEEANEITLVAPSREFAEKELAGNMQLLLNKVSEYFNDQTKIKFEYKTIND